MRTKYICLCICMYVYTCVYTHTPLVTLTLLYKMKTLYLKHHFSTAWFISFSLFFFILQIKHCETFSSSVDRNIDCLNLLLGCAAEVDVKDHLGR